MNGRAGTTWKTPRNGTAEAGKSDQRRRRTLRRGGPDEEYSDRPPRFPPQRIAQGKAELHGKCYTRKHRSVVSSPGHSSRILIRGHSCHSRFLPLRSNGKVPHSKFGMLSMSK